MSWKEDGIAPPGHQLTFKVSHTVLRAKVARWVSIKSRARCTDGRRGRSQEALNVVSRKLFLQLIFPMWFLRWGTPAMREFYVASDELQVRPRVPPPFRPPPPHLLVPGVKRAC